MVKVASPMPFSFSIMALTRPYGALYGISPVVSPRNENLNVPIVAPHSIFITSLCVFSPYLSSGCEKSSPLGHAMFVQLKPA